MQQIFNKVDQNQLQRINEECGKLPQYEVQTLPKHFRFQPEASNRAEMSCGTRPTGKWGWLGGKAEGRGGGEGG